MKIAVPGAAGVQGRAAIVYLLEQKDVSGVLATDIRAGALEEIAARMGDPRLAHTVLDLSDYDASVAAFKGYDVVLNCALTLGGYTKTTKAAAEAGCNYLDLTTKGEREAQRALNDDFARKGIVCVQDMGVGPGFTNIMATYLMNKLDKTETIDFKMTSVDLVPAEEHSRPLNCPIPLSDLLYLFSKPVYFYEDGVLKELEPRSLGERFTFAEPVGTQFIAGESHSEPLCLSRSFGDRGIKRISYKGSFGEDIEKKISFLRDLGFANRDPIDVKGVKVAPHDVLQTLVDNLPPETKKQPNFVGDLVAIVAGVQNGAPVEYRMRVVIPPELHKKMVDKGCSGAYRAGLCGSVAAVIMGRGQVKAKGVVEPELAIPPEQYLEDMVRFGFKVEIAQKTFL